MGRKVRAPKGRAPGNTRGGETHTVRATETRPPKALSQARVKGWGKSPPAPR